LECEYQFDKTFSHSRNNEDRVAEKLTAYRPDLVSNLSKAETTIDYLKDQTKGLLEAMKSIFKKKTKVNKLTQEYNHSPSISTTRKDLTKASDHSKPQEKKPEQDKENTKDQGKSRGRSM
jgi:chromosome segregation ATPase